jgi:hypothetical protein
LYFIHQSTANPYADLLYLETSELLDGTTYTITAHLKKVE